MFTQLIFFFFLFILLFFISRKITGYLYKLIYLLTSSQKLALFVLVSLLLPGNIIHEVAHFIIATILRVPTGQLTVIPTIEKNGEVRAGRLMLGSTDPFRYTLVGIAPMITGLTLVYLIGKFSSPFFSHLITANRPLTTNIFFLLFVICYMLFVVSTTMFSSKKDLDSLIFVAPVLFLMTASLYLIGIRIALTGPLIGKVASFFAEFNYFLLITNLIDFAVLFFLALNLTLWQKMLGKKIKQV